jgi:phosphoglycerol transferase MdoB-like AlkP superfamily enzyme
MRGRLERRAAVLAGCLMIVSAWGARAAPPQFAWQVVSHDTPALVWVDRMQTVRMRLRNTGTATWSEASGDHLSYHWLAPDGTMVTRDGARTSFPAPVPPGKEVEVEARLEGPKEPGRWLLEWEMVREQVRWYGPPASGEDLRIPVRVVRWSAFVQTWFALLSVGLVLGVWYWRPRSSSWTWGVLTLVPTAWAAVALGLAALTFADLLGHPLTRHEFVLVFSSGAVFALPTLLVRGRQRVWGAFAVVASVSVLVVGDLLYMRYFGSVVPVVAVAAARQLGQVEGSVRALFTRADVWLLPSVVVGLFMALLWPRWNRDDPPTLLTRRTSLLAGIVLGAIASVPAINGLAAEMRNPVTSTQVFSEQQMAEHIGVLNVHLFDVARTFREWSHRSEIEPRERALVDRFFDRRAAEAPKQGPWFGIASGDNVILIQVESLQQWVVGAKVKGVEITPFMNSLRERALYFSCVFDQTQQGRSSDGEFAALNSQHPLPQGAVAFRRANNHFVALPGILKKYGYTTLSANAFERGFWNRAVVHPRYGIEHMYFKRELGPGEVIGWGLADGVFFSRMVPIIEKQPQPFFAFPITLGLHHPFDLFPNRHKVLDVGELKDTPLGNYIHAMHYFDASLKEFLTTLERDGVLRNTIVAFYGDHEAGLGSGREVLNVAGYSHWTPSTNTRLFRIPFFVLLPGSPIKGEIPVVGGHVDIAPTLLYLLGLPRPHCFVGTALVPGRAEVAVARGNSAVGHGLMFVGQGDRIPDEGGCFSFPEGDPRPLAECKAIDASADEERKASYLVVEHDLAPEVEKEK